MKHLLLVAIAGAIGAVARWKLSSWILHHSIDWRFPLATFTVNILGCFLAGLLAGLIVKRQQLSMDAQLFLLTGLLGGFTTFSAFGVEVISLLRRGDHAIASAYAASSLAGGVLGIALGMWLITPAPSSAP